MITHLKKPKSRKGSDKRSTIILRAAQLFLSLGFENTSMSQIAEHAGVAKQTLYSYFGSKEALFTAAIEEACRIHALTPEIFDVSKPLATVLRDVGQHAAELMLSREALQLNRICISGCDQYPTVSKLYWEAGPKWILQQLSHYIGVKALKGEIDIPEAEASRMAKHYLALVRGQELQRRLLGLEPCSDSEIEQHIEDCVDFFSKAVGVSQH